MSSDRDDAQGRQETPSGWSAGEHPGPWQYGQPQYGQPQYGQPPYGTAPYGQYGPAPFGPAQPARPGTVITAAVLALVFAALGLLVTVGFLVGGALIWVGIRQFRKQK